MKYKRIENNLISSNETLLPILLHFLSANGPGCVKTQIFFSS